jgi:hypothetical protein
MNLYKVNNDKVNNDKVNNDKIKNDKTENHYDRFFKNKNTKKEEKKIFNIENQHFPGLLHHSSSSSSSLSDVPILEINTSTVNDNIKTFANIASISKNISNDLEELEQIVPPGWVSLQYDKKTKKTIVRYGEKTHNMIEQETRENFKNTLHYRMNNAINQINKNREKYIQYYDEIYGEGSYKNKFGYNSDYSSDIYDIDDDENYVSDAD